MLSAGAMRVLGRARRAWLAAAILALAGIGPLQAGDAPAGGGESVDAAVCRLIEAAAATHDLPAAFFTRLIWRESSFRPGAVSPAGAQGIAQFMPGTALARGLENPFDPEQAIPQSARFLADLLRRFGNLGLAAAAYNGGPERVAQWLAGAGGLAAETRDYVAAVTRRSVEDWAALARSGASPKEDETTEPNSCLKVAAALRGGAPRQQALGLEGPFAPWGVQLAGNFSKARALESYARARAGLARIIGEGQPMVIGTRLRSRGTRAFYRVRVPAPTRAAAAALCERIRAAGGACIVLRS